MRIQLATIVAVLTVAVSTRTTTHAGPNIIYVNAAVVGGTGDGSSWANAAPDLGFAMFNHTEPAEFWVAAGTYDPFTNIIGPGARNGSFRIRAGQAVYGGFAGTETQRDQRNPVLHQVTLTGERPPSADITDNFRNVVRFVTTGTETGVLDGVTVTRGNDDSVTPTAGGIVVQGGDVTISGVTVRENYGASGGGIHVMDGTVRIEFASLSENGDNQGGDYYEGGLAVTGGTVSLKRVNFAGGPGLLDGTLAKFTDATTTMIDDVALYDAAYGLSFINGGADVRQASFEKLGTALWSKSANVKVDGAYFADNDLSFRMDGGTLDIANSTFVQNNGFIVDSVMSVRNATFVDNAAAASTVAPFIYNSIIVSPGGTPAPPTTPVTLAFGIWDGTCGGAVFCDHISDVDPMLLPLANVDSRLPVYPLKFGSPAVDEGDPDPCPASDQRLGDRPIDGDGDGIAKCDLGAYELRPPRIQFTRASSSRREGLPGSAGIAVEVIDPILEQAKIDYSVTGGTAGSHDFSLASGTLTFEPSGARSQSVAVTVLDDFLVEPTETVVVTLGNPVQSSLGGQSSHTFQIVDNEPRRKCSGVSATIVGSPGSDNLVGTSGRDVILGRGGKDTIHGLGGDDLVCGGPGDDSINGDTGADILWGQGGSDSLEGSEGNDRLGGGGGSDVLSGRAGNDVLLGGRGDDRLFGNGGRDRLAGGPGSDSCNGGPGIDKLAPKHGCETTTGIP